MSLTQQIAELCKAGFTVNTVFSPSQEEGKLNATFLLSGDEHLKFNAHASKDVINLLKKTIQITPCTPEELEQTVIAELKPVVEERVPISNSIKEEYDKLMANRAKAKGTTKPKGTVAKKKTAKETARDKAEKAMADLPLFQSDRSAKAKESLEKSLSSGDNSPPNSSPAEPADNVEIEL